MITTANRLAHTSEYYFSKKLKEVKKLINDGKPVINLGIGSPDLAPPPNVVKTLIEATNDKKAHQYQPYAGIDDLRQAISDFYANNYAVKLDKDKHVLPLMGSKEGIMHICMAFVNPGDEILIPNPGYPTYVAVARLIQANSIFYDLKEENDWQPDFEQLANLISPKTKLMWINYPHMPTGTRSDNKVLDRLVKFAKKHHILLVNDNPYSLILNDKPHSILENLWPNKHVLELNSLSKTFNLSGWRIGMLCGDKSLLDSVIKVKSNMDSGMFYPIQKGGIAALQSSSAWFEHLNAIYTKRRQLIWQLCDQLHLAYEKNTSGLFVWAKISSDMNSKTMSDVLLNDYDMFITPGDVFGSQGEGYVRFSLCVEIEEIKICLERTKDFQL